MNEEADQQLLIFKLRRSGTLVVEQKVLEGNSALQSAATAALAGYYKGFRGEGCVKAWLGVSADE